MNLVKAPQQGPGGGLNFWEGQTRDRRWAADPAQPRILNRGPTARDCAGPPEGEWVVDRVPPAGRAWAMAIRGAKPTPTSFKLITGNPGHRAINRFEPRPCMAMPAAPAHLNSGAKAEWSRVCDDLGRLGLLTGLDRAALAAYCQAYGRWEQAEAALTRMAERDLTTYADHLPLYRQCQIYGRGGVDLDRSFAAHDEGGHTWARMGSLIESCKMNAVNPYAYLRATLTAIANRHPASRIDDLMPWEKPSS